ncbi:hypothetical protein EDB80DRAFT_690734 [Ilyonectria destructans]|nr:hypothetical protein EDB80DRAFT_690734 [Ilyonectria destructans]
MEWKEKGWVKQPPPEQFPPAEEVSPAEEICLAEEILPAEDAPADDAPAEDAPTEETLADECGEESSQDGNNDTGGSSVNEVTYDTRTGGLGEPRGDYQLEGNQIPIRMRVSSRHLIFASPVFQIMLDGPFKEGTVCELGRQIIVRTWDAEAITIILNIIHGHHRECQTENWLADTVLLRWKSLISLSIEGLGIGLIDDDEVGLRRPPGPRSGGLRPEDPPAGGLRPGPDRIPSSRSRSRSRY